MDVRQEKFWTDPSCSAAHTHRVVLPESIFPGSWGQSMAVQGLLS